MPICYSYGFYPIKKITFLTYYMKIYSFGNAAGYFLKLEEYNIYHIQCFNILIEILYMTMQYSERPECISKEELLSEHLWNN